MIQRCIRDNLYEIAAQHIHVISSNDDDWYATVDANPGDHLTVYNDNERVTTVVSAPEYTPSHIKPSIDVTYIEEGLISFAVTNPGGGLAAIYVNASLHSYGTGEYTTGTANAVPGDIIKVTGVNGECSVVVTAPSDVPFEPKPTYRPSTPSEPVVTPSEPACPHMAPEIRNGLDEFDVYEGMDLPDGYTQYKAPTCTANGYQSYFCIWCDREVRAEVIPALEHKNTDGQDQYRSTGKYVPATCSENKKRIYACRVCGEAKTVDMRNDTKLGHRYDPDGAHIIVREATCTQTGQIVHICANPLYVVENGRAVIEGYCSERINEMTEALGHDFAHEKDSDTGIAIGKCARCGTTTLPTGPEPKYGVFVSGKKGYIQLSNKTDIAYKDMYVRYSVGYDASGTHFAVVTTVKIAWNDGQRGQTGTFTLPNIQSGGWFTGASCIVTTDANADELSLNQAAAQSLGMLIQ